MNMDLRLRQFGFNQSAPPAQNTAAWNRAVSCVPAIGARIIIEDGVYQHYGLSLKHQKNVSIIGGGGDHSKTRRTQLLEASGQTHCLTIEGGQYIEVAGLMLGHSVSASAYAALKLHGFLEVTVENFVTWQYPDSAWSQLNNSGIGIWASTPVGTPSGGLRVQSCTLNSHPQAGIFIQGDSGSEIQESYIFNNTMMNNTVAGMHISHDTGGTYIRGNSCWNNGSAIIAMTEIIGAARDLFLDNNILDFSIHENLKIVNFDSIHLKGNWFSWAGSTGNPVYNVSVTGSNTTYPPTSEVSNNIFVIPSVQHGGLSFDYKKSRIQGNTFNGPGTGIHLLANSAQNFVHGNFSTDNQTAILDEGTNNHLEGNFAV
jgi:hypothetical protein